MFRRFSEVERGISQNRDFGRFSRWDWLEKQLNGDEKGSKRWGEGLVIRFEKVCRNMRSTWIWTETFQKKNLFIWLNSEAEWFHLRDARQFANAYVQLVGGSCKLESESWSYFSEVWGQGCEHEVILATEWGSGKQRASVSAASWQQGKQSAWDVSK